MSDVNEDIPTETIQEYCQQLGLQLVRENSNSNVATLNEKPGPSETSEAEGTTEASTSPKNVSKSSHTCTNCGKCFSSSRQYLKHECSTVQSKETPPKKAVRSRKQPLRNLAAKAIKGMEPTTQVDEDTSSSVVHIKDHTYNRDDEMSGSPSKVSLNPSTETQVIQCDVCKMFPDSVSGTKSSGQCERRLELCHSDNQESMETSETDHKPGIDSLSDKKRKYVFRKPEQFCPHCNKGFHSDKRLAKHQKVCGKDLVCEFCGEDFNGIGHNAYNKYEEHYYTHVEEKPFQCSVCKKGFVRKPDLDKHNVIHTAKYESQMCTECGEVFATTKLLNKHKKKHERPTWECPKCKRQFLRQVIYEKHMLTCQVQVSCEVCGKIFTCLSKNVKYRYQEHMFIHTGEKPYKCQYCERAFRDRSTRKKHERTHTGEKPYPCTICNRAFSQLRLLRNHVRTHTGEKPFACELCDLRFAKQCNLKYHIRVHTKEKPYACQLCQKTFSQSGTYHKHMRRHAETNSQGNNIAQLNDTATAEITKPDVQPAAHVQHEPQLPTQTMSIATESEVPVTTDPEVSIATSSVISMETDAVEPIATESEVPVISANHSQAGGHVVQRIPLGNDEITIIVSEGNVDEATLGTIEVEQISKMFAS